MDPWSQKMASTHNSKRITAACLVWLCLVGLTFSACSKPLTPTEERIAAEKARELELLAEVNGEPLSTAALQRELSWQPTIVRSAVRGRAALRRYLRDMIQFKLLKQEAIRQGFNHDPDVETGTRQLLAAALWEDEGRQERSEMVDEAAIKAQYEAHPELYTLPPSVTYLQLTTRSPDKLPKLRLALACGVAALASTQFGVKEAFQRLANQHSETRASGVKKIAMTLEDADEESPLPLIEAALSLKVGQLSSSIVLKDGAGMILLLERSEASLEPLSKVKNKILQGLLKIRRQAHFEALEVRLAKEGEIEILDESLRSAWP